MTTIHPARTSTEQDRLALPPPQPAPSVPPSIPQPPRIYPAYTHPLAPTNHAWVPLSCASAHALHTPEPAIYRDGRPLFHHGNHPVEWVKIVGVVVAWDDYGMPWAGDAAAAIAATAAADRPGGERVPAGGGAGTISRARPYGKATVQAATSSTATEKKGRRVLMLDDGSGACLECVALVTHSDFLWERREQQRTNLVPGVSAGRARHLMQLEAISAGCDGSEAARSTTSSGKGAVSRRIQTSSSAAAATSGPTIASPEVDWSVITIGAVVKVKGQPSMYSSREGDRIQISVIKMELVKGTDEEVRCWADTARWMRDTLSRPWVLTEAELARAKRRHERRAREGDVAPLRKRKKRSDESASHGQGEVEERVGFKGARITAGTKSALACKDPNSSMRHDKYGARHVHGSHTFKDDRSTARHAVPDTAGASRRMGHAVTEAAHLYDTTTSLPAPEKSKKTRTEAHRRFPSLETRIAAMGRFDALGI